MKLALRRRMGGALFSVVALSIALALPFMKFWILPSAGASAQPDVVHEEDKTQLDGLNTLRLPASVADRLGLRTADAKLAAQSRPLAPLSGSLALDTDCYARIHSRFAGEVVALGTHVDSSASSPSEVRPLCFGDRVEKGQLLAVVWSKDLGEKKSELIEVLSRLHLDQETLDRLQVAFQSGAVPERSFREAQRTVEAGQIATARIERTLLSWRLSPTEIEDLRAEAGRTRKNGGKHLPVDEQSWARVEVRAPFDGTILEKNVAVGDLVDTSTDLFRIADLSHLCVWAHVYEEDLPLLLSLPQPIHWKVRLKANPAAATIAGAVSRIGEIIDPSQHTALVLGRVDNRNGLLRVGQFVTATVDLPPSPDEVEVPTAALLEDGSESTVFVQPEGKAAKFVMRAVKVARRMNDVVVVRSGLRPGERVVVAGGLELRAALEELQGTSAKSSGE